MNLSTECHEYQGVAEAAFRKGRMRLAAAFAVGVWLAAATCRSASAACNLTCLEVETRTQWIVITDPGQSSPSLLRPRGDPGQALSRGDDPGKVAMAFLSKYAGVFSMTNPATELVLEKASTDASAGTSYASFVQRVKGVPVMGSRVAFLFDARGRIVQISSFYIPNLLNMVTSPAVDAPTASAHAEADMRARFAGGALVSVPPRAVPQLYIVLLRTGDVKLAYVLSITLADAVNPSARQTRDYLVDAARGTVLSSQDSARR